MATAIAAPSRKINRTAATIAAPSTKISPTAPTLAAPSAKLPAQAPNNAAAAFINLGSAPRQATAAQPANPALSAFAPGTTPFGTIAAPKPTGSPTVVNKQPGAAGGVSVPGGSLSAAFAGSAPQTPTGLQDPGNNLVNPGYSEQALNLTQDRLLNDPSAGLLQNQYGQTQQANAGEQALTQNLGTLNGPGQGDQYWNQVQGQFSDPFAGEQFTREATQNMAAQGAAGAFNQQAQGQYGQFTGYTGPQNTQGQYGQSSQQLAGGTQGEQNMGAIAGGYDSTGRYTGPNNALNQYEQTQGAFGDLPIAEFDPFYDRARQLGVQDYNRQAAGRGVYGSSEALSGVGNVITDIEAQRANRSFDAEMQRAQEQRARQALLGEQARMGDLSATDAFGQNLKGAETFSNINRDMGNLELNRNELLGNMANQADTQALGAQEANISGLNAFGDIANNADRAETDRFSARTTAMNNADRTGLDRLTSGADIAFRGDENARLDYTAEANAANQAGNLGLDRTRLGAEIGDTLSDNDLNRLNAFNDTAFGAETQRQGRQNTRIDATLRQTDQMLSQIGKSYEDIIGGSMEDFENNWKAEMLPLLQDASTDQKEIDQMYETMRAAAEAKFG